MSGKGSGHGILHLLSSVVHAVCHMLWRSLIHLLLLVVHVVYHLLWRSLIHLLSPVVHAVCHLLCWNNSFISTFYFVKEFNLSLENNLIHISQLEAIFIVKLISNSLFSFPFYVLLKFALKVKIYSYKKQIVPYFRNRNNISR